MKRAAILVVMILMSFGSFAQPSDRAAIMKTIHAELPSWLNKIPPGREGDYGFSNREEFGKALPGELYMVYTVDTTFFTAQNLAKSNCLFFTGDIRVPVIIDHENRALITLAATNGTWKIRDLGATALAGELQDLTIGQQNVDSQKKILRIFQFYSDFVFTADASLPASSIALVPLKSARLNFPELSGKSYEKLNLSQLHQLLKSKLQNSSFNYENK